MSVLIMSDAELTKFEILRDVDHERMPKAASRSTAPLEIMSQLLIINRTDRFRRRLRAPATASA
jgi:hypothetical protein